ncbi:hypothetical protein ACFL0U_02490 [Pseudomonadota bacterium]
MKAKEVVWYDHNLIGGVFKYLSPQELIRLALTSKEGYETFKSYASKAKSLNLYNEKITTQQELISILNHFPNLEELHFPKFLSTNNNIIHYISNRYKGKLKVLHLPKERMHYDIDSEAITTLAKNCPSLTSVNLEGCYRITDGGIIALAKNCPGLTSVDLRCCNRITDDGIIALAKNCPGLTRVDLYGCDQITDAGIIALATNCPDLTSVNFGGCYRITDDGIIALATNCPSGFVEMQSNHKCWNFSFS